MSSVICRHYQDKNLTRVVTNCREMAEAWSEGYGNHTTTEGVELNFGSAWKQLGGVWETEEGCDGCSLATWWKDETGEYVMQLTFVDANDVPIYQ